MFEIGQQVVCVDDAFPRGVAEFHSALPFEGQVYTVRDVTPGQNWDKTETCAIHLHEIQGKINQLGIEHGFAAYRFRPLDEIDELQVAEKEEESTV